METFQAGRVTLGTAAHRQAPACLQGRLQSVHKASRHSLWWAAALTLAGSAQAAAPSLSATSVLSKLDAPWDMAFAGNGAMFFTEKCKGLSIRQPSGAVTNLLGMKDAKGYAAAAEDLFCDGQAGMNGVAVDPEFDKNRFVYVFSTSNKTSPPTNRVLRLKVNAEGSNVSERTDIVADIGYKPTATQHPFGGSGAHNGAAFALALATDFCTSLPATTTTGPCRKARR